MWNGWQDWSAQRDQGRADVYRAAFGFLYDVKPTKHFSLRQLAAGRRDSRLCGEGGCDALDHTEYWRSDELPCALITSHVYRWDLKRAEAVARLRLAGLEVVEPGMPSWYNERTTLLVIRKHAPLGAPKLRFEYKEWHERSERRALAYLDKRCRSVV